MSRQSYPLSWPEGWKRTAPGRRQRARFNRKDTQYTTNPATGQRSSYQQTKQITIADAVQRILYELITMGISPSRTIISTNVEPRLDGLPRSGREPEDPGAAVYWEAGKTQRCMAIDMYDRVADNLGAIAATLAAMRAIERHGGATILDRAFLGFAALPETASKPWREVFGIAAGVTATLELVETRFKNMAQIHHPDKGGDREVFERIVQAREAARMELSA